MKNFYLICAVFLTILLLIFVGQKTGVMNLAAVFFTPSITTRELQTKFEDEFQKIRILLVPGHEPDFGGAEYGSLKERDMNVDLARMIAKYFEGDERFEIIISRDKDGWNSTLQAYFDNNWNAIQDFVKRKKLEMDELLEDGRILKDHDGIKHNRAPDDIALRLYGINKWSSERGVDLTLHIHFNDYPRTRMSVPGIYRGFAVYVPDSHYSNAEASREIAEKVFASLESKFSPSNFGLEEAGIIESQTLIALGSRNTLDSASVLIEYGYIYRPSFTDTALRAQTLEEMAQLTHEGLLKFFEE